MTLLKTWQDFKSKILWQLPYQFLYTIYPGSPCRKYTLQVAVASFSHHIFHLLFQKRDLLKKLKSILPSSVFKLETCPPVFSESQSHYSVAQLLPPFLTHARGMTCIVEFRGSPGFVGYFKTNSFPSAQVTRNSCLLQRNRSTVHFHWIILFCNFDLCPFLYI